MDPTISRYFRDVVEKLETKGDVVVSESTAQPVLSELCICEGSRWKSVSFSGFEWRLQVYLDVVNCPDLADGSQNHLYVSNVTTGELIACQLMSVEASSVVSQLEEWLKKEAIRFPREFIVFKDNYCEFPASGSSRRRSTC